MSKARTIDVEASQRRNAESRDMSAYLLTSAVRVGLGNMTASSESSCAPSNDIHGFARLVHA
jgi:hypothetical protein